jgi:hypothetical protein
MISISHCLGVLQPEITSAFHGSAAEYLFLNFIASTTGTGFDLVAIRLMCSHGN